MIRYTVAHCDTHEPLFRGDGQGREKVRGIIGTRSKARLSGRLVEFVASEWYVTGWDHDRLDPFGMPEIVGSVSATEFMDNPRALED